MNISSERVYRTQMIASLLENRLTPYLLTILLFVGLVAYGYTSAGPAYLSDEIGYLTKAASLAGYQIDFPTKWYGGYSILLAPLFYLFDNPFTVWRGVEVVNAALFCGAFLLTINILSRLFEVESKYRIIAATLVAALYPTWIVTSAYAFSTPATVFFYCVVIYTFLRIDDSLWFLILNAVVTGFLYWVHPLGLAVVTAGVFAYAIYSYRTSSWRHLVIYLALVVFMVLLYRLMLYPALYSTMSAYENTTAHGSHYPKIGAILSGFITTGFWKRFILLASSQTLAILSTTFALVGFSVVFLVKKICVKRLKTKADVLSPLRQAAYVWLLMSAAVALVISVVMATYEPGILSPGTRVDLWVYGRYIEPYIYPLLALGIIVGRSKYAKATVICLALLLLAICCLPSLPHGPNNIINISSFWPFALFPKEPLLYWLIAGTVGIIWFCIVPKKLAVLSAALLVIACVRADTHWHRELLGNYSKPDPVIAFVRSNYDKGTCVAWLPGRDRGRLERRNMLAFYLYNYGFRPYTLHGWKDSCAGPILFQRNLEKRPKGLIVVARSGVSGIAVAVRQAAAAHLDYSAFNGTSYIYDPTGQSPCLRGSCLTLTAKDLHRFSKVGVLRSDGLWSDGQSGYLFFGPYIHFQKGNYKIEVRLDGSNAVGVVLDIVSHRGHVSYLKRPISVDNLHAGLFSATWALPKSVSQLEVRLYVGKHSSVVVHSVKVRPAVKRRSDRAGLDATFASP